MRGVAVEVWCGDVFPLVLEHHASFSLKNPVVYDLHIFRKANMVSLSYAFSRPPPTCINIVIHHSKVVCFFSPDF